MKPSKTHTPSKTHKPSKTYKKWKTHKKGGVALPAKTENLRIEFPVSSGNDHRGSEWRPVSHKNDAPNNVTKPFVALPPTKWTSFMMPSAPPLSTTMSRVPIMSSATPVMPYVSFVPMTPTTAPGPQAFPPRMQQPPKTSWQSKHTLGQFTGTSAANMLTPRELASGRQAWAKQGQLARAKPVAGGMGMTLLQKMGWRPGKGLGKEGTGTLKPLLLEAKLDTRGLVAKDEMKPSNHPGWKNIGKPGANQPGSSCPTTPVGKHPVTLLGEYCIKQKLAAPLYTILFESGPVHKRSFLFKVRIDGVDYQPSVSRTNKKQAKADAAQIAVQKLGIAP